MAVTDPIEALNAVVPTADARMLDLTDGRFPRNTIGLMLADTVYAGRPKESFAVKIEDSNDVDYKLRFDVDFPRTQGANWRNLQWSDTEISPSQFEPPIEGRFDISGFKSSHWIDEPLFNRLTKSQAGFVDLIEGESAKINNSKYKILQDHIMTYDSAAQGLTGIPTRQGNVTNDWATWGAGDTYLMSMAYILQSGYTGNAATGTGTYQYGSNLDLNLSAPADLTRIKAVSAGNSVTAFGVMDPSNIRTKIDPLLLQKDKAAAGKRQIVLCDSATRNYIMNYAEAYVRTVNADQLNGFGYTDIIEYMGRWWCYEPYLDYLAAVGGAVRVAMGIDTSSWIFRHHKLNETEAIPGADLKERQNVKMLWKWDFRAQLLCKAPWLNWYAYDVRTS